MKLRAKILIIGILCLLSTNKIVGQEDDLGSHRIFISALDSTANSYMNTNFSAMQTWLDIVRKTIFDSTSLCTYKCIFADLNAMHSIKGNWVDTIMIAQKYLLTQNNELGHYGQAIAYWSLAMMQLQENSPEAKENFKKAAIIFGRLGKISARKNSETMLTEALIAEGKYATANFYSRQLLDEAIRDGDKKQQLEAWLLLMRSYNQLGVYEQVEHYKQLIENDGYYKQTSYIELKFLQAKINYLLNINNIHDALDNVERLSLLDLFNNIDFITWRTELILARLSISTHDIESAKKHLNNCRNIQKNHKISGGTEYPQQYLPIIEAQIAMDKGNYQLARKVISSSPKPENIVNLSNFANTYYTVYENICVAQHDYKQAIIVMAEKEQVKKSLLHYNTQQRTLDLQFAYQNDTTIRRQNAILFEKSKTISSMRAQSWLGSIIASIIATASILIFIMTINRRKKRDEKRATQRKLLLEKEVEKQTLQLKNQNQQLNYQNQEVVSSQTYARHIQQTIMPSPKNLDNFDEIKGSFIIYKAAEMLSGDFYWFRRTNGGRIIICCADSWGRGVPGAMMTMVGITLMTDTIMNNTNLTAADVMQILNIHLLNIIPDMHTRDGINCSIAIIDSRNKQINLSLARQNALFSHNGNFELLKGVNRRVGDVSEPFVSRSFENIYLDYHENDSLYLYTDGATNIFGGKLGKKLKIDGLQNMFRQIENEPLEKRQLTATRLLSQWHQNQPENDDITIIGITLN